MRRRPILVVEDNPDDEALILRALKKANVANPIDVVRDGAEALEYLLGTGTGAQRPAENPSVVLLDLKLPKVDGLEVLQRLRDDPATTLLPVVVLTSSDEEEDILRSYRLRANSYVRKPVDFGKFSEVIQQLGLFWLLVNEPAPEAR